MANSRFAQAHDRIRPVHIALAAAIVVLGGALRVQGAMGEMWLDEVWSLDFALHLNAWHEAFWTNFSDNSHPLNTVWLHLMGANREPWIYRFASISAGTLAIIAAGWSVTRHGAGNMPARLLTAMLLVAVLYPFVHFGSEARGYAQMTLFAYLAFAAAEDSSEGDYYARWRFALWGALGLASHLGSVPLMVFLAIGHALRLKLDGRTVLQALNATVRLSGPYVAVLLAFAIAFFFDLKAHDFIIPFGDSPASCAQASCFVEAMGELARFSTGGFGADQPGLYVGLSAILTLGAVAWLGAVGNRRAVFYAVILLGLPLLYFAAGQPSIPYGRYFLNVYAFWPLLLAEVMGELTDRGRPARWLAGIALLALITVNAWAVERFNQTGRGDYSAAFARMMQDHKSGPLTIGTNMAFQFKVMVDDLVRRKAPDFDIVVIPRKAITATAPTWLVTVTVPLKFMARSYCEGPLRYTLVSAHPYWGFSGSPWGLYKKALVAPSDNAVDCPSVPHARARFR